MKFYRIIISAFVLLLTFMLIVSFTFNDKSNSTLLFNRKYLKDNEEVGRYELLRFNQQACASFAQIQPPKTNIIVRALENDVRFNDLLKMGIENFSLLRSPYLASNLNYWNSSNDRINSKDKTDCPWNNYKFSKSAWKERTYKQSKYYVINTQEDDRFKDLVLSIYKNPTSRNWMLDQLSDIYSKVNKFFPKDWKINMLHQFNAMDSFLTKYENHPEYYDSYAERNEDFAYNIGYNQALLFRRIKNDHVPLATLKKTIQRAKNEIFNSLNNSIHNYTKGVLINDNFQINEVYSPQRRSTRYRITSLSSKNSVIVDHTQLYKIKILKDGSDFLQISSWDNKRIVFDSELNILLNELGEVYRDNSSKTNKRKSRVTKDQTNETVLGQKSKLCKIDVYNRWGVKVASISSQNLENDDMQGWNELINKSNWDLEDGTYFYSMKCPDASNSGTINKTGNKYTIK